MAKKITTWLKENNSVAHEYKDCHFCGSLDLKTDGRMTTSNELICKCPHCKQTSYIPVQKQSEVE